MLRIGCPLDTSPRSGFCGVTDAPRGELLMVSPFSIRCSFGRLSSQAAVSPEQPVVNIAISDQH